MSVACLRGKPRVGIKVIFIMKGWIKLHRQLLDNPLMKKPAYRSLWIEILLRASHNEERSVDFKGKVIKLKQGQFTAGAYQLSEATGVPRGTVERVLKKFSAEGQIDVKAGNKCSLISILGWRKYQGVDIDSEERVRNRRGTDEEQMRTNQECKELKNEKNKNSIATSVAEGKVKRDNNDPVDLEEFCKSMRKSKRKALHIIAEWAETVSPGFTTYGQWQVFIKRSLRAATSLESFSQDQMEKAYRDIMKDSDNGKKFKPSLETIIKYLTK